MHEDRPDEMIDMEHLRLFPNHTTFFDGSKYPEHTMVPVFVPGTAPPGVTLKPHYPKELVYANNIDRSMEEIKAEAYLERYVEAQKNQCHQSSITIVDIRFFCFVLFCFVF